MFAMNLICLSSLCKSWVIPILKEKIIRTTSPYLDDETNMLLEIEYDSPRHAQT